MPASPRYIQSVLGSPEASNTVARVLEPAATIATATAAEPVAGIAALLTGDADTVGKVQDRLTYNPRSKAGQEGLKALSDAFVEMAEAIGIDDAVAYFEDTVVPSLQSRFGDEVGAAMGAGLMAGAAVIPVPARKIKAYHGSPHVFEEFSTDAIGTGEGAQVYGRGLYFAEDEKVARQYKQNLTEPYLEIDGRAARPNLVYAGDIRDTFPDIYDAATDEPMISEFVSMRIDDFDDPEAAYNQLEPIIEKFKEGTEYTREFDQLDALGIDPDEIYDLVADRNRLDTVIGSVAQARSRRDLDNVVDGFTPDEMRVYERFVESKIQEITPEGRLYEVDIDADPDELLDWDAMLDEQPEKVRQALENTDWYEFADEGASDLAGRRGDNPAGMDLVRWLEEDGAEEAAQALKDAGIKGIKYADGFTRHKSPDKQMKNYVIFDAKLIQIAKVLGVAIPVAAALIAKQTGQDPDDLYKDA